MGWKNHDSHPGDTAYLMLAFRKREGNGSLARKDENISDRELNRGER